VIIGLNSENEHGHRAVKSIYKRLMKTLQCAVQSYLVAPSYKVAYVSKVKFNTAPQYDLMDIRCFVKKVSNFCEFPMHTLISIQ
jgi:hypothetical protein